MRVKAVAFSDPASQKPDLQASFLQLLDGKAVDTGTTERLEHGPEDGQGSNHFETK